MDDPKRDYLIKTFSRTKRKDFENYVINAVWHKLDRSDVHPVTQQYIKFKDGRYALIDLYFPQVNIGIECDEEYHLENELNDARREMTMEELLSVYHESEDFTLYRIKAYEKIDALEQQIDDVVSRIKDKLQQSQFRAWDFDAQPYDLAMGKKMIHVADRLSFRTITDICKCFGKKYTKMQLAFFNIGHGYQLWCPKLAVYNMGKHKSVSKGWINLLSDDWETIRETNDNPDKLQGDSNKIYSLKPRIVFAKSSDVLGRNEYRFIGVFRINEEHKNTPVSFVVHERIDDKIDLTPWLNSND